MTVTRNEDPEFEQALRTLPRSLAPERDLWPDIARQLASRRSRLSWLYWGTAALFVLMAAGTQLGPAGGWIHRIPVGASRLPAVTPKRSHPSGLSRTLVEEAQHDPYLPRATRAILIPNLLVLDRAQYAIDHELSRHPGAPGLGDLFEHLEIERSRFLTMIEKAELQSNPRVML